MRAMFERLESKWLWLAGVALLALLTMVAVLQFHWITQLAEADRRQRQELLATAVGNIRRDFAETINRVVPFFRRSSGIQPGTDIEGRLNELVTLWQRENRFPLLESAGLGIETSGGTTVYKLRRLNDAQFISLPWPEELSLYRHILEYLATPPAVIQISPSNESRSVLETTASILKSLTRYSPSRTATSISLNCYSDLTLADPDPFSCEHVDVIIGADLYSELLLDGIRRGSWSAHSSKYDSRMNPIRSCGFRILRVA